jgi:hypothetical protein
MSENDAQHVKLAVGCTLSRHDTGRIAFQQIGKGVGTERAGVYRQLATVNLSLLVPCPLLGVRLEPECSG